ncbi:DUF7519 family protein [Natronobacterium lacisalsi]
MSRESSSSGPRSRSDTAGRPTRERFWCSPASGGAAAVEPTLVGAVATVLAWDRAQAAIDLGEQLGREARTLRLEAVGLASSLVVGLASATVGYAIYVVGSGGQPVSALVLLLLAAVLLTVGLGSKRKRGGKWGSSRRGPRRR